MADDPALVLPTPPDPPDDGDWGEIVNDAFRELETRVNTLRQYVLDHPGGGSTPLTDADLAALIADVNSATHAAIVAMSLQLGTTSTTAAAGDHNHDTRYATPAYVTSAIQAAPGAIAGAPTTWPSTFPPSTHTHTSSQISDSTSVGRQVLSAPTALDARTAIGAMASTFVGLQLGSTATTAAAGNHRHTAANVDFVPTGSISATNVQDAIVQASVTSGGTGGTGSGGVIRRFYRSGGYLPALATTKPAGIELIEHYGAVQPTGLPAWVGLGPTQVPSNYEYMNLT